MKKVKYDLVQLKEILLSTIKKGLRHQYYDHVVDHARFCKQIVTGDDQDDLIVSYKIRETGVQKKQRIRITNTRTQYVAGRIIQAFSKVERADNVVDNIKYESDADNKRLDLLSSRLEAFYEDKHMDHYLFDVMKSTGFTDPNAFLVVEFDNSDPVNDYPHTYPFEVSSEQAIMYEYVNGNLQYLICDIPIKYTDKRGGTEEEKKGHKYTIYAANYAIVIESASLVNGFAVEKDGWQVIKIEDKNGFKWYYYKEFNTKTQVCPARRIGYIKDPATNRQTCVSPLHAARSLFKDLINTKSEFDLTKALHGFLQKIIYAPACEYKTDADACHKGFLNNGEKCPVCKGKGKIVHTSVQDVIELQMPDGKEEHIPLSEMVHYVIIPEHIIKMQIEELERLEKKAAMAVFNTNVFDRSEVAITATEKRIDLDAWNNVLADYGMNYSMMKMFCVKMTAICLRIEDGLINEHEFPSDFAMETLAELLVMRKTAIEAGAPYQIINRIDNAIMMKQNQDDPDIVRFNQAMSRFRPFREKTKEERMFIIGLLEDDDPNKVLWIHFEEIFCEIKFNELKPLFYEMTFMKQKEVVQKYLDPYLIEAKAKKEAAQAMALAAFAGAPGENPDEEEEEETEE